MRDRKAEACVLDTDRATGIHYIDELVVHGDDDNGDDELLCLGASNEQSRLSSLCRCVKVRKMLDKNAR